MSDIYLRYVGKDKGTILNVPARDLTYEEAKQHDLTHLIASGLYEYNADAAIPEQYKADLKVEPKPRVKRTKKEGNHG